ncbi:MAG: relaxase/mobilization nuclease domain-containing protein [Alphaproteobacteria bacterium]|nr:relaxase/mobilization nuclease domain-containing protein [Alphaproteobacteria bacterium]
MLAQLETPTNDFLALARYLFNGRERPPNPDRVAWTMFRNLATDDPELAAHYMAATAELSSSRCKSACLHTIIAWREDERPTPEIMQEIAVRTLELAGLSEHEALIMGHGDKAHPHLHMMINRVHPETQRAWSTSFSWRRFDRIMRQLSEDYGFDYVPAHAFNPELTETLPKKPNSEATYAAKRGGSTTRTQWSTHEARTFAERINERLDTASGWDDIHDFLAPEGLVLEAKGKGYVVGNASSYVKLSALGLQRTAMGFQKRRPPSRRPRKSAASRPILDAVDITKALASWGLADRSAVRNAVQEANRQRMAKFVHAPLMVRLLADLKKVFAGSTANTPPDRRNNTSRRPTQKRSARQRHRNRDR